MGGYIVVVDLFTAQHQKVIYSSVWKAMKENQECTSGDYYMVLEKLSAVECTAAAHPKKLLNQQQILQWV